MSKIGANLRKIRLIKGLSQAQFAEIFSLTRASIGAYEEGRAEPKIAIAIEIAKYFSITLDTLFTKNITVNELANFDISKATKEKETSPLAEDRIALNYIDSNVLTNKDLLKEHLKKKKIHAQIEFPKWFDDIATLIDLKDVKIEGANNSQIKAVVCSRVKKPKKSSNVLAITENDILIGECITNSSKLSIRPFNSIEAKEMNEVLFLFQIQLFITENVDTLNTFNARLTRIEDFLKDSMK